MIVTFMFLSFFSGYIPKATANDELPPPTHEFGGEKEYMVEMSDGIKLKTYVAFPEGEGPWPVLMTRNPYSNSTARERDKAKVFAKYGYAAVVQEARGTGGSEGKWVPFENERKDGIDTLQWLSKQSWNNGKIGTHGNSYLGFTQWVIADQPEVTTMFITVFGTERYKQMYNNGMFRPDIYTSWTMGNAGVPPLSGKTYEDALMVRPQVNMDQEIFGVELPWYRDWVTNVSPEAPFWQSGLWAELGKMPSKVNVPVFFVGGWYDHHFEGMLYAWNNLSKSVKDQSRFVIGPWNHVQVSAGQLEYPNGVINQLKAQLEWFNHHLKDEPYNYSTGNIESYVIGEGVWKNWKQNGTAPQKLYLTGQGGLDHHPPAKENTISYQYEPDHPVLTNGAESVLGGMFTLAGPRLQEAPGYRDDVITFVSEPLKEDLRLSGRIKANLYVASDAEDTSFTVKVSEVFPDGKAYNIRNGITSLAYRNGATTPQTYKPGEVIDVNIETWPITWTIKKGSRIRVDISSSNFPEYMPHSNYAGIWGLQGQLKVAKQTLSTGGKHHSYIEIPSIKK